MRNLKCSYYDLESRLGSQILSPRHLPQFLLKDHRTTYLSCPPLQALFTEDLQVPLCVLLLQASNPINFCWFEVPRACSVEFPK